VEQVETFTYLGTEFDRHLSLSQHVNIVYKKSQQCLFLLTRLKSFNVRQNIMITVHHALVESELTFNFASWFNFISAKNKVKLSRVIKQASKMIEPCGFN